MEEVDPHIVPLLTRRSGSVFLHVYNVNRFLYFCITYREDGTMPASDIVRHGLLVKDAMGAVGGAMYAAITGSKYKNPTRLEVTMLNPEGLQKAINDAFESPEEAFNRLGEKYRDHFTTKAQRAAGILKQGSDKENEDR